MHHIKTLLLKDFRINKKTMFLPFWITLGFYGFILLGVAIAYFKQDFQIMSLAGIENTMPIQLTSFLANLAITTLPGNIAVLFTIILTQSALNEDIRKNCELFHRSQPVSIWERTFSKYFMGTFGNWLVLLTIVIFNFIIVNSVLVFLGHFDFFPAISATFLSLLATLKYIILIGSIVFFFSAIFKDKAFFKGIAILMGVNFLFQMFNWIFSWKLPLPLSYLLDLFHTNSLDGFEKNFNNSNFEYIFQTSWKNVIWNLKSLWQLLFSAAMFAISTFIYKYKEVK